MEETKAAPNAQELAACVRAWNVDTAATAARAAAGPALEAWDPTNMHHLPPNAHVLVLGRCGTGKTTALCDIVRGLDANTRQEQRAVWEARATGGSDVDIPCPTSGIELAIAFTRGLPIDLCGRCEAGEALPLLPPWVVHSGFDEHALRVFMNYRDAWMATGCNRPSLVVLDDVVATRSKALRDMSADRHVTRTSLVVCTGAVIDVPVSTRKNLDIIVCLDARPKQLVVLLQCANPNTGLTAATIKQLLQIKAALGPFWALVLDVRDKPTANRVFWFKAAFPPHVAPVKIGV